MNSAEPSISTYEQLPYESNPFHESHPGHLQAIGYLHGMEPSALATCRVLELGCASGGNLIPAAEALPGATFVGVDLAPNQIAEGRVIIETLGIKNVQLHAMSLTEITREWGEFDYIIAHGIYSWVPPEERRRLLEVCKANLAPGGIAYISYNTNPGWRLRGVMRDMLEFGLGAEPGELPVKARLARGRAFTEMIVEAAGDEESTYSRLLRLEGETILKSPDSYIAHEYMEAYHEPLYFQDFAARASECGLAYLADARFNHRILLVENRLRAMQPDLANDPIRFQQCVDFAFGRQFRRSLLCHADEAIHSAPDARRLMACHLSARLFAMGEQGNLRQDARVTFQAAGGASFSTGDASLKAAIGVLAESFPSPIPFEAICDCAGTLLRHPLDGSAREALASLLLGLLQCDFIEARLTPPCFTIGISMRPMASPLARWQASNGQSIHNRRHRTVRTLTPADIAVLKLLDGTRDSIVLERETGLSDYQIEQSLQQLATNALLIG